MKSILLSTLVVLAPMVSLASPIPGGLMKHELPCQFVEPVAGVGYRLLVTTQALAPQHNVRAISLHTRVAYPNAPTNEIKLAQASQDINQATFVGGDYTVVFDKSTFKANVFTADGRHLLVCGGN